MSNYRPGGKVVVYKLYPDIGPLEVHFKFEGPEEYKGLMEFIRERGFSATPPAIKVADIYRTAAQTGSASFTHHGCSDHGNGPWIKPNKGRGKHRFYCAYQLEEGGYCGKKIT